MWFRRKSISVRQADDRSNVSRSGLFAAVTQCFYQLNAQSPTVAYHENNGLRRNLKREWNTLWTQQNSTWSHTQCPITQTIRRRQASNGGRTVCDVIVIRRHAAYYTMTYALPAWLITTIGILGSVAFCVCLSTEYVCNISSWWCSWSVNGCSHYAAYTTGGGGEWVKHY